MQDVSDIMPDQELLRWTGIPFFESSACVHFGLTDQNWKAE